jgi:carboxymethylenebutenolidase
MLRPVFEHAKLLVCCTFLACQPTGEAEAPAKDPGEAREEPEAEPLSPKTIGDTIAEDQFKALHELSAEQRPAPLGEMIDLAGTKAYFVAPHATAPLPGVVVVHEWWGLNDHVKYWADRLAADGYAAIAVDLYGGQVASDPDGAMALMKGMDEARAQEIMAAAHRFLAEDPRVGAKKRGVIGWCMGGGWALRQAMTEQGVDAAVIYYGRLVDDPKQLAGVEANVLGIFGNQDEGIPPAAVDAFEAAMQKAKRQVEIHRYEAPHAFANPSNPRYDTVAAGDAWEKVRGFLRRELASP